MAKKSKQSHQSKARWERFDEELKSRVDWESFYNSHGCQTKGATSGDGWVKCLSHEIFGGEDRNPSASFNVHTGYYHDFRAGTKLSPYDFMVAIGLAPDWLEAKKKLASSYGVKFPTSKENKIDKFNLMTQDEADVVLTRNQFCSERPGILPSSIAQLDAKFGVFEGLRCFSFPMFGTKYQENGYLFIPIASCGFENGIKSKAHRLGDTAFPSGFIGGPAMSALACQKDDDDQLTLVWTEGPTDMLAGYSAFPDVLFMTNPYGCQESLGECRRALLDGKNVKIIRVSDADQPGLAGGGKHVLELQREFPNLDVKLYYPPYPIEENHGKDLRDFIHENDFKSWDDLFAELIEEPVELASVEEKEEAAQQQSADTYVEQGWRYLKALKLQFVARDGTGGFTMQSLHTGCRIKFPNWQNFGYLPLLSMCGASARTLVDDSPNADDRRPNTIYIGDLKEMLSCCLSEINNLDVNIRGDGLWVLEDELVAVKQASFWRYHPTGIGQEFQTMIGNNVTDYEKTTDWFDAQRLNASIKKMKDPEARTAAYHELFSYVDSWAWENEHMSMMVCGLFYACWLQAALPWRPTITLVGETDSGKTWLLTMLAELYLNCCQPYGKSTVAGVMQKIGFSSLPLELDEFDQSKNQRALFSEFRGSSRGQVSLKGTASQEGKAYALRHMPWLSGIFTQATSEADKNRLIELSLKKVNELTINRPTLSRAHELGYDLLASVIVTWKDILKYCQAILDAGNQRGKRTRYRESYAIPYGTLAAILGVPVDEIVDDMESYIKSIQEKDSKDDAFTDQESALDEIMGAIVVLGPHAPQYQATVAQVLFENQFKAWRKELETMGVVGKDVCGSPYICINDAMVTGPGGLLRDSDNWAGNAGLKQVLKRLPRNLRSHAASIHIAGRTRSCHLIHRGALLDWLNQVRPEHLFDKNAAPT